MKANHVRAAIGEDAWAGTVSDDVGCGQTGLKLSLACTAAESISRGQV